MFVHYRESLIIISRVALLKGDDRKKVQCREIFMHMKKGYLCMVICYLNIYFVLLWAGVKNVLQASCACLQSVLKLLFIAGLPLVIAVLCE